MTCVLWSCIELLRVLEKLTQTILARYATSLTQMSSLTFDSILAGVDSGVIALPAAALDTWTIMGPFGSILYTVLSRPLVLQGSLREFQGVPS